MTRIYPTIAPSGHTPARPISFVVVRFSDEYFHNILQSECIHNPINELIEVDNSCNLFFDNLSSAISHGVSLASHELIVVVHEDVLLPDGWQSRFEESLGALEQFDTNWGMLGSVGWNDPTPEIGHWSDPHQFKNTFEGSARPFQKIRKLDEQILIFHKTRLPAFDLCLPGIHFLGEALIDDKNRLGQSCYVIDAPTIHKYADKNGDLILSRDESEKIRDRDSLTYLADKSCCDDYFERKYAGPSSNPGLVAERDQRFDERLDHPVILVSRGGSGSRVLSAMAQDAGIFLGNDINASGDSMELVIPIYKMIIEKFRCRSDWQKTYTLSHLRSIAAKIIEDLPQDKCWGFKLPESALILPELAAVFPGARYVYFQRDPLHICLRRTHMTARLDNHIGRIALPLAYDAMNVPRRRILADSPAEHMAYTTLHQVELIRSHLASIEDSRKISIRFEDTIEKPSGELARLLAWLPSARAARSVEELVDADRAGKPKVNYAPDVEQRVRALLRDLRKATGYL